MRYLHEVTFYDGVDEYDAELGVHVTTRTDETKTVANVTDIGTQQSVAIFGDIKQGAKVIRLTPLFALPKFRFIEFQNKKYKLVTQRNTLNDRNALIVQEVL
ncbi:hypothetical protein [Enterococcus sp. AZ102]|uniref:hypothetical protein n=1 Tax=Enterococcus sp. AZ102 TaxID=2774865 RepID=UPI003F24BD0F